MVTRKRIALLLLLSTPVKIYAQHTIAELTRKIRGSNHDHSA
jgi:hypothetical protein